MEMMNTNFRQPAVAGTFYPDDAEELRQQLQYFYDTQTTSQALSDVAAIVVPHAGYVYSGSVAAEAFASLPIDNHWDNIFVIGSSHHHFFEGAALPAFESFGTPLGEIIVNQSVVGEMVESSPDIMCVNNKWHLAEHTLEVQLPFIQYRFGSSMPIVPVLLGCQDAESCQRIAQALKPWFNAKNLFVFSTDLSHYPNYEDAAVVDSLTIDAILTGKPEALLQQIKANDARRINNLRTSLCGWTSILTLLYLVNQSNSYVLTKLKYCNSGDALMGDHHRVVGYSALRVDRKSDGAKTMALSDIDQTTLLKWAHVCLYDVVNQFVSERPNELVQNEMCNQSGVFISLYNNGKLRGCIGRFVEGQPLWRLVKEMTYASATTDPRFSPVTADEVDQITIEISVLTPFQKILSINEIELGRHGIYIKKDGRSGTFLPQVASKTGWSVIELLEHCAHDKAGLARDEWQSAEIYTYEAVVFGDHVK
jgi:AmmeMemoRadiSam system protein B/AmmeMemoRadiSam system protein A